MKTLEHSRRYEVRVVENGETTWQTAHLEQLEAGDIVRIREPDGSLVIHLEDGATEFRISQNAHIDYV